MKEKIIKTAQEFNMIMGLKPRIDVKEDIRKVKYLVLEAIDLIEPQDTFSKYVYQVVADMKKEEEVIIAEYGKFLDELEMGDVVEEVDVVKEVEILEEEPTKEERVIEEEEEEEILEEEILEEEKKFVVEEPIKKKKVFAKKTKSKYQGTRHEIGALIIKDIPTGQEITKDTLISMVDDNYMGKSNLRQSETDVNRVIQCLRAYGIIAYSSVNKQIIKLERNE